MESVLILLALFVPICMETTINYPQTVPELIHSFEGNHSNAAEPKLVQATADIHEFLEQTLDGTIVRYILKPLTKPGDNYNSALLELDVQYIRYGSNEVLKPKKPLISSNHAKNEYKFVDRKYSIDKQNNAFRWCPSIKAISE